MTETVIIWALRLGLLAFVVYAMVQWWWGRRELEREELRATPAAGDAHRVIEP